MSNLNHHYDDGCAHMSVFFFVRGGRGPVAPSNPYLKKNQNTPRPSEHPPVRGKKIQNV